MRTLHSPQSKRGWLFAAVAGVVALLAIGRLGHHPRHGTKLVEPKESPAGWRSRTDYPSASDPSPLRAPPSIALELPKQVSDAIREWRNAIFRRDAAAVTKLDRTFRDAPDLYASGLVQSARSDSDERVRAFSTRMLGKLDRPDLGDVFRDLLDDRSPYVRQNAAWALGELFKSETDRVQETSMVAMLKRLQSSDPDDKVRAAAGGALDRLR